MTLVTCCLRTRYLLPRNLLTRSRYLLSLSGRRCATRGRCSRRAASRPCPLSKSLLTPRHLPPQGSGSRVGVQSLASRVQGSEFRVQGSGLRDVDDHMRCAPPSRCPHQVCRRAPSRSPRRHPGIRWRAPYREHGVAGFVVEGEDRTGYEPFAFHAPTHWAVWGGGDCRRGGDRMAVPTSRSPC